MRFSKYSGAFYEIRYLEFGILMSYQPFRYSHRSRMARRDGQNLLPGFQALFSKMAARYVAATLYKS